MDLSWLDTIGNGDLMDESIELLNINDQENEWRKERLGKVTGSQLGKLVVKDRKDGYKLSTGKVASDMLYKIAWERFLITESEGLNRLNVSSQSMQHGNDYELSAIDKFTEVTGIAVEHTDYKFISKGDYFGGTPDGFTEDGGLIECKAPWNGGNHLKTLLTGKIYNDDHFYQIQGYLFLTGLPFCWYVTFDPDLPEGLNISYNKIERDEEVISAIESIVEECKNIVEELINKAKLKLK